MAIGATQEQQGAGDETSLNRATIRDSPRPFLFGKLAETIERFLDVDQLAGQIAEASAITDDNQLFDDLGELP